jgi:hypothetical protein
MGEYEPDDSRKVTLTDNRAPGEPPRTGPREDEARRAAQSGQDPVSRPAQQGQAQAQGGQSQSQSQSQGAAQGQSREPAASGAAPQSWRSEPGNPDRQAMQGQPDGALSGDQPQAIDAPTGSARPADDQYEVNQPRNMHRAEHADERKIREQATIQGEDIQGFGYGADDEAEMADAPDASDHADERTEGAAKARPPGGSGAPGEDYRQR